MEWSDKKLPRVEVTENMLIDILLGRETMTKVYYEGEVPKDGSGHANILIRRVKNGQTDLQRGVRTPTS